MNKCDTCRPKLVDAKFVVQWGPNSNQKIYVCASHLPEVIDAIDAIEFFVVKVNKIN